MNLGGVIYGICSDYWKLAANTNEQDAGHSSASRDGCDRTCHRTSLCWCCGGRHPPSSIHTRLGARARHYLRGLSRTFCAVVLLVVAFRASVSAKRYPDSAANSQVLHSWRGLIATVG